MTTPIPSDNRDPAEIPHDAGQANQQPAAHPPSEQHRTSSYAALGTNGEARRNPGQSALPPQNEPRTTKEPLHQSTDDLRGASQPPRDEPHRTTGLPTLLPHGDGRSISQPQRRAEPGGQRQREQVAQLVAALADADHPQHTHATGELLALGDAAVPALTDVLNPSHPWLAAYRAAETLGQIGDGRATAPLIEALRHENANVRWAAVGALAQLADVRAIMALRRVAQDDRGRTTWGESVAGAAQGALDQLRTQNVVWRSADLLKTAIAVVAAVIALALAWNMVGTLRSELSDLRNLTAAPPGTASPLVRTAQPRATAPAQATVQPTAPAATVGAATPAANLPQGTALVVGNVRSQPSRDAGQRVGVVSPGDEIGFVAVSPDKQWYRVRLGAQRSTGSQIISSDGTGWVLATVVSPPTGELPTETGQ